MKIFKFAKVITFCLITFFIVDRVSEVLVPVEYSQEEVYSGGISSFCSFYAEPDNTLDVIYLGSSHIYSGISPIQIYENYGITGFDCATSSQNAYKSYHCLIETLKTQTPKVVVMDLMSLTWENSADEISNWNFMGKMKLSKNFIETSLHEASKSDTIDFVLPALRYHERWEELTKTDFTSRFYNDYTKMEDMRYGNTISTQFTEADFPQLTQEPTDAAMDINPAADEYIKKIAELCQENNISLLFIKTPVTGYTLEQGNAMKQFADSLGIPLIDYNQMFEEIGFDYTTDFLDTVHLNLRGRTKVSDHLGNYLASNYDIDTSSDPAWEEAAVSYNRDCKANQLQSTYDTEAWFETVQDKQYLILASGNTNCLSDDRKAALGLTNLPVSPENPIASAAGCATGEFAYSDSATPLQGNEYGCKYYLSDQMISANGVEYSCSNDMLTLVVYDTVLEKIIDSCKINGDGVVIK